VEALQAVLFWERCCVGREQSGPPCVGGSWFFSVNSRQTAAACMHGCRPARSRALGRQGRAGQAAAWQAAPAIAGTRRRFEQQELGTWGSLVEGTVEGAIMPRGRSFAS